MPIKCNKQYIGTVTMPIKSNKLYIGAVTILIKFNKLYIGAVTMLSIQLSISFVQVVATNPVPHMLFFKKIFPKKIKSL